MKRHVGLSIFIMLLFQSFTIKDNSFTKYYQALQKIDLPLQFDCLKDIQYPDLSTIPPKLDGKYRPEGHKTFGRIELSANVISIIQVAQAENEFPEIFTYKLDGTPIDTLILLSGSCTSSPEIVTHSVGSIGINKTINMTDSSFFYKLDQNGLRHENCDSIVISRWQCRMNDDGHFAKKLIKKEIKTGG